MQIKDKIFLVTGGGSGLGRETATFLFQQGAKVAMADVNPPSPLSEGHNYASNQLSITMDVREEKSVEAALEQIWTKWGHLHGVVNCAGVATPGKLIDKDGKAISLDIFKKVIDINLTGTINVIRLYVQKLLQSKPDLKCDPNVDNGIIINTASVAAFEGQIGQIAYASSKGAVAALTLPLARELSRYGIRVMTIAPGIFSTPMLKGLPEKAQASLAEQVPYPARLGRPEEYAALVGHIVQNSYLNGEIIRLDGAIRMGAR